MLGTTAVYCRCVCAQSRCAVLLSRRLASCGPRCDADITHSPPAPAARLLPVAQQRRLHPRDRSVPARRRPCYERRPDQLRAAFEQRRQRQPEVGSRRRRRRRRRHGSTADFRRRERRLRVETEVGK